MLLPQPDGCILAIEISWQKREQQHDIQDGVPPASCASSADQFCPLSEIMQSFFSSQWNIGPQFRSFRIKTVCSYTRCVCVKILSKCSSNIVEPESFWPHDYHDG
jgi:hypothetical protein